MIETFGILLPLYLHHHRLLSAAIVQQSTEMENCKPEEKINVVAQRNLCTGHKSFRRREMGFFLT